MSCVTISDSVLTSDDESKAKETLIVTVSVSMSNTVSSSSVSSPSLTSSVSSVSSVSASCYNPSLVEVSPSTDSEEVSSSTGFSISKPFSSANSSASSY